MNKSKRAVTALAAAGLLLSTLAPGVAFATDSDGPGGNVAGDACAALGFDWQEKWEWNGGTYTRSGGTSYLQSVTGDNTGGSFTAADGYLVGHVFVKGGNANDGGKAIDPPTASGTFDNSAVPEAGNSGGAADISNVVFCGNDVPEEDPDYSVAFTKTWAGDDIGFDDHHVTFIVNGDEWNIGDHPAPVALGDNLEVTERVTELPEGCDYTTDLDSPVTVPTEGDPDGETFVIDVTNTVDCTEVEDDEFAVAFTKTWAGDDIHFDDHDVTFIVNGDKWNIGDHPAPVALGDELTVTEETTHLPDHCTYTTDLDSPITIIDDGSDHDGLFTIDVTNTVDCTETKSDDYFVAFTKTWAGDDIDLEDVEVTFVIDENLEWKLGAAPAQVELGKTYEVEEVVTGLPDDCDYTTDLKSSYTIPTDLKNGEVVIIHVTNKVTCTEVENDASFNVSFTKAWVGDIELAHLDDVSVTFDVMIDGSEQTVADGEVVKVDGSPDDIDVELLDEHINGLPDTCTWKFGGTSLGDDDNIDVTVTNKVTCTEVESVVIEKPRTPPHTSPVVTGKAPVAPAVTGKAPVAPVEVKGVSMTAGRQEMPRTGVPALLLSLMGMAALGTGGMMVRRRP